jgi:hypothetical protein
MKGGITMGIFLTVVVALVGYAFSTGLYICLAGMLVETISSFQEFDFVDGLGVFILIIVTLAYVAGMVGITKWLIKRLTLERETEDDVIATVTNKKIEKRTYTTYVGIVPTIHHTTDYNITIVYGEYEYTVDDYTMYQKVEVGQQVKAKLKKSFYRKGTCEYEMYF